MDNIEKPIDSQFNNPIGTTPDQTITPELNTESVKTGNKKKIILIVSAFLLVFLILLSVLLVNKNRNNKDLGIQENETSSEEYKVNDSLETNNSSLDLLNINNEEISNILKNVVDIFETDKQKVETGGEKIMGGEISILSSVPSVYIDAVGYTGVDVEFKNQVKVDVEKLFLDNEYSKNETESKKVADEIHGGTSHYDYVYEKNNIKCVMRIWYINQGVEVSCSDKK